VRSCRCVSALIFVDERSEPRFAVDAGADGCVELAHQAGIVDDFALYVSAASPQAGFQRQQADHHARIADVGGKTRKRRRGTARGTHENQPLAQAAVELVGLLGTRPDLRGGAAIAHVPFAGAVGELTRLCHGGESIERGRKRACHGCWR